MSDEPTTKMLEERIRQVCGDQARYPVLFVVGKPRSGKTPVCRAVCARNSWRYVDFTLEPGCLDRIIGREEVYSPEDFVADLREMCATASTQILVVDEVEPLLALWRRGKQDAFFKGVGRSTHLGAGLVIVTRLRNALDLAEIVPGPEHIFAIAAGVNDG